MYYIAVYDINEKKVGKALKLFRRYLNWVQNSVFEGNLTEVQMTELKAKAKKLIDPETDSVIFYSVSDEKWLKREILGLEKNPTDNII
jgi:CRISPR-associated protein Cas2